MVLEAYAIAIAVDTFLVFDEYIVNEARNMSLAMDYVVLQMLRDFERDS